MPQSIPEEHLKLFVRLARKSIETFFSGEDVNLDDYPSGYGKRGIFVTLYKKGELRGCIGFPQPSYELRQGIINAAHAAAINDPRFDPLEESELKDITVEVSILTIPHLITVEGPEQYLEHINIGLDGLIIETKEGAGGLLLPQVFEEMGCTPKEALEALCKKANLSKDAWKDPENKIYSFQAQIAKE